MGKACWLLLALSDNSQQGTANCLDYQSHCPPGWRALHVTDITHGWFAFLSLPLHTVQTVPDLQATDV